MASKENKSKAKSSHSRVYLIVKNGHTSIDSAAMSPSHPTLMYCRLFDILGQMKLVSERPQSLLKDFWSPVTQEMRGFLPTSIRLKKYGGSLFNLCFSFLTVLVISFPSLHHVYFNILHSFSSGNLN